MKRLIKTIILRFTPINQGGARFFRTWAEAWEDAGY